MARLHGSQLPLSEWSGEVTQIGVISGTVDFMAPEQALDAKSADHRADIYSLGCTLYYLLTGQLLYSGRTLMEKIIAHREQAVPQLSKFRPDVPKPLDGVFSRMVAKSVHQRYQSMEEVLNDLEACDLFSGSAAVNLSSQGVDDVAPTRANDTSNMPTWVDLPVMLVEPSRVQSRLIRGYLEELGVRRIQSVSEGCAAIRLMLAELPALVISAMHLPDITGSQMLAEMRRHDLLRDIPFILVSSQSEEAHLEQVKQSGAVVLLTKPFEGQQLRRAVDKALQLSRPHGPKLAVAGLSTLTVLVVDDSHSSRKHVRRVLETMGFEQITEATDGRQAVELLECNRFDLVVTDYHMPHMDGKQLVTHIRNHPTLAVLPVLMVTSETDASQLVALRKAGVSEICHKTFEPEKVRTALERLLKGAFLASRSEEVGRRSALGET